MSVTDGMLTIEVPKAALAIFTMIAVVGMLMILPRCLSLFQTLNAGLVRTAEKAGFRFDPVLTGLASLTWFVVFATLLTGLFTAIVLLVFRPVPTPETVWSWRFSLAQIAGLTAVLGAIIALPFTIMRLLLNRKQTETAEQGMITDRINKAVAGLGEGDGVDVFVPHHVDPVVRVGLAGARAGRGDGDDVAGRRGDGPDVRHAGDADREGGLVGHEVDLGLVGRSVTEDGGDLVVHLFERAGHIAGQGLVDAR